MRFSVTCFVFLCRSGTCLTWTDKTGPVDSWILRKRRTVIGFTGVILSWILMRIFSYGIWTIHRYCSLCSSVALNRRYGIIEDLPIYLHSKTQICILKIVILFCITIFPCFLKKQNLPVGTESVGSLRLSYISKVSYSTII